MRRFAFVLVGLLASCGARSELIAPMIERSSDASDVGPPDAPPIPTACTWTPMGSAVQLSDSAGAWHLEDVALANDRVFATWHAIAGGDVLIARVGFGGERLEDAHAIAAGQFTAVPERVTQLAVATDHVAAFTLRNDGWVMTHIGSDGSAVGAVSHVMLPAVVRSVALAADGYTALTEDSPEPRVVQLAAIDDTGTVTARRPIISPAAMLGPIFTRALRDDGSFLVSWTEQPSNPTRWVQAFTSQGDARGPQNSFPRSANAITASTTNGYLMLWLAPRSSSNPTSALWAQAMDAIGALSRPSTPVDTAGLTLPNTGPLAAARVGSDMLAAYVENDSGSARLVVQSLDGIGNAQQQPARLSTYVAIERIVVLETPSSAALIFEATPHDGNGASQVYGLGLTCLR